MMANIVDDLNLFVRDKAASVVYYFAQHDFPTSTKARTIIGSITRQLLSSRSKLADTIVIRDDLFSTKNMLSLLRASYTISHKAYLILDGLDLCHQSVQEEVAQFVKDLQEVTNLLACVSYRQEPRVKQSAILRQFHAAHIVPIPDNSSDIEVFIEAELAYRLESRALILGDATLILEIQDALLAGSKGMFLWVALQITSLCSLHTDEDIREALKHLPKDLSDVYAQLLRKQQELPVRYRRRIFELMMAAQRPMTTSEIREALSVSPGDTIWTATKLINDVHSALATCGCLVIIDEEESTVRFVHPTVEQFLLAKYTDPDGPSLEIKTCHKLMAELIVTYLNYQVFGTDVSTYLVPKLDVGSAPASIISSLSSAGTQSLALKLLKLRKQPRFNIGKTVAEEIKIDNQPDPFEYRFQHYARSYCLKHVAKGHGLDVKLSQLFIKLLVQNDHQSTNDLDVSMAWEAAIEEDNASMARCLTDAGFFESATADSRLETPTNHDVIANTICGKSDRILEYFRQIDILGPKFVPQLDKEATLPYCYLVYFGDAEILQRVFVLINRHKAKHICKDASNLLAAAIWCGNEAAVKTLLEGYMVDVNQGSLIDKPIWRATEKGNNTILHMLLYSGRLRLRHQESRQLMNLARELGHSETLDHLAAIYTRIDAATRGDVLSLKSIPNHGFNSDAEPEFDVEWLIEPLGYVSRWHG